MAPADGVVLHRGLQCVLEALALADELGLLLAHLVVVVQELRAGRGGDDLSVVVAGRQAPDGLAEAGV